MIIIVDKTTKEKDLRSWEKKVRNKRMKNKKNNLEKYFGILPNIGDGLEFQKKLRDEWE
jgi:hypothetical protein